MRASYFHLFTRNSKEFSPQLFFGWDNYSTNSAENRSRDCFFLIFSAEGAELPINQLQARLHLEGQRDSCYFSVRAELQRAEGEYRSALAEFKKEMIFP